MASTRTDDQLAAVAWLFDAGWREVLSGNVVLATALEYLAHNGPHSTSDVAHHVRATWRGYPAENDRLEHLLQAAADVGLLKRIRADNSSVSLWLPQSPLVLQIRDVDQRVHDLKNDFHDDVQALVVRRSLANPPTNVDALTKFLIDELGKSIEVVVDTSTVAAPEFYERSLVPHVARPTLNALIDGATKDITDPDRRDFAKSALNLAFDPTDDFGRDVVRHFISGHVMSHVLAQADLDVATAGAGDLSGETVVLDHNVLLTIAAGAAHGRRLEALLQTVLGGGLILKTTRQAVQWVSDAVEQPDERVLASIAEARAARSGQPSAFLRASIDDPLLEVWLDWLDEPEASERWDDFVRTIRHHLNRMISSYPIALFDCVNSDSDVAAAVQRFLVSIGAVRPPLPVGEHGSYASLLHLVDHDRRGNPHGAEKVWPGAVLLTARAGVADAYRSGGGADPEFPPILTGAQLAVLATAVSTDRLELATTEISKEGHHRLACRIPTRSALEIQRVLLLDPRVGRAEATDIQTMLRHIVARSVDLDQTSPSYDRELASRVVHEWLARQTAAREQEKQHALDEIARLRASNKAAAEQYRLANSETDRLRRRVRDLQIDVSRSKARTWRATLVAIIGCLGLGTISVLVALDAWLWVAAAGACFIVFILLAVDFIRDPRSRPLAFIVSCTSQIVGIIGIILSIG
jgi:hypothetical protein